MAHYYLEVPVEEKQGYWTIEFSQGAPDYVGTLVFIETGGGGGETQLILNYTNLVENLDGTFTCFDTDGNSHILIPTYDSNNVITSITYDGKNVKLVYDSQGNLTNIGDSEVNIHNYPDPEPSGNIGYQVTFKVEGNDYYIASCQQGESITEPPTPTGTGTFTAWQLNGVDIIFPYTPSADVELTANFATVRTEMEITGENTVLFNSAYGECKKVNADMCILGVPNVNNFMSPVIIGETASATEIKDFSLPTSTGTYTYGLKTYYYTTTQNFHTANLYSVNEKAYRPTTTSVEATIQATLDHYLYND